MKNTVASRLGFVLIIQPLRKVETMKFSPVLNISTYGCVYTHYVCVYIDMLLYMYRYSVLIICRYMYRYSEQNIYTYICMYRSIKRYICICSTATYTSSKHYSYLISTHSSSDFNNNLALEQTVL